jgi:hypothetical protein
MVAGPRAHRVTPRVWRTATLDLRRPGARRTQSLGAARSAPAPHGAATKDFLMLPKRSSQPDERRSCEASRPHRLDRQGPGVEAHRRIGSAAAGRGRAPSTTRRSAVRRVTGQAMPRTPSSTSARAPPSRFRRCSALGFAPRTCTTGAPRRWPIAGVWRVESTPRVVANRAPKSRSFPRHLVGVLYHPCPCPARPCATLASR